MSKILFLGASVALVILVDLATGQGPPALNSYMAQLPPPPEYRQSPPTYQKVGYMPRGEYDAVNKPKYDKPKDAYRSEKELYEKEKEYNKEYSKEHNKDKEYKKDYDKEYEKDKDYGKYKSTPAPGVLGSFSNSMSDAWKSLTSLGRSKRNSKEDHEDKPASRPIGDNSYVFFKVPRKLVCSN